MIIPGNKRVVCITGSVFSGARNTPRRLLVKDGFLRPTWFTTQRPFTDAKYHRMSNTEFHLHKANNDILACTEYSGGFVGILKQELDAALQKSVRGGLIVGPQEIVAQVAEVIPETIVFTLKDEFMKVSRHLAEVNQRGQLHRVDVDVLEPGAWTDVYAFISEKLGLELLSKPF